MNDDQARQIHAEELARQTAPDKKCGRPISLEQTCPQIVKVGQLCPACGVKVE
jgi:hypothetical protein